MSDVITKPSHVIHSHAHLPLKPECDVFHLRLDAERPLQPGRFRDLFKATTAYYYPGAEPPEIKITGADRGPERLNSIIVALRGSGYRLEYLPFEAVISASGNEVTLTFWIAR